MTKAQLAYADTLNLFGSDIPDPYVDAVVVDTLAAERRLAAHSTGPHADCPKDGCYWTTPYNGWDDGEHFADMWEHLISEHHTEARAADSYVRISWRIAALESTGPVAA